jgi:hypothetical protein
MKHFIIFVNVIFLFACVSTTPKEVSISTPLAKLDSINSWYNRLVVKQIKPIYVFQTEPYNKDGIEIKGNIFEYHLIEEGKEPNMFSSDFLTYNFEFAKLYLRKKGLSKSKILLQIPVRQREGFINDHVSIRALEYAGIDKLERQEFYFDNSIASLVDSKRFNPNFTTSELPKYLTKIILNRFEKVKTFLPEKYRSKIIKSKLIISEPTIDFDPSKLFLHNIDGDVKISSLLIRAILVKAISEAAIDVLDYSGSNFELKRPVQLLKMNELRLENPPNFDDVYTPYMRWESTRETFARMNRYEIEHSYNNLINTINSTLDFLFLHEFSHIYLGPNMLDEFRADCYAYLPLKKQNSKIDFGAFSDLMVEAVQNKGGHYWLVNEDSIIFQQIIDRYNRVKKIDSLINNGVLQIDMQCESLDF